MSQLDKAAVELRRSFDDCALMLTGEHWYVVSAQPPYKPRSHGYPTIGALHDALRAQRRSKKLVTA